MNVQCQRELSKLALYLVKLIFCEYFCYFDSNRVTVLLQLQLYLDANRVSVRERINKILMEMQPVVIVWLGGTLLVFGGGLHSTDEFKNVTVTSLALDASLVKCS